MGRIVDTRKHEAILEAAGNLFLEKGFAATSIEAIAAQAGVSKVTIYNQFQTKERLFREAVSQECAQLDVELSWGENAGSLRDELINFGASLNAFLDRPELLQFQSRLEADLVEYPEIGTAFLNAGPRHVHASLAEILTAEENDGRIMTSAIDDAAEQLISMCRGMGDLEMRFGHVPSQEQTSKRIAAAVDLFLSVYGCEDKGPVQKPDERNSCHG